MHPSDPGEGHERMAPYLASSKRANHRLHLMTLNRTLTLRLNSRQSRCPKFSKVIGQTTLTAKYSMTPYRLSGPLATSLQFLTRSVLVLRNLARLFGSCGMPGKPKMQLFSKQRMQIPAMCQASKEKLGNTVA